MMSASLPATSLVPQLLQAFSAKTGLAICLLDAEGKRVVSSSPGSAGELLRSTAASILSSWNTKASIGLADILPGMKMFLLPVQDQGTTIGVLAAGMVLEPGSRPVAVRHLADHPPEDMEPGELLKLASEVGPEQKRDHTAALQALSETMRVLFGRERHGRHDEHMLSQVARLAALSNEGELAGLLEAFLGLDHAFDFAGFANVEGNECVITHCVGNPAGSSMIGTTCMIGEGFIGQTAASGTSGVWQDLRDDPRAWLFHQHGIVPDSLLCCPVMGEQTVSGVLFAGSATRPDRFSQQLDYGLLLTSLVRQQLIRQKQEADLSKLSQRIRVLKEIVRLLAGTRDAEKLAYMLVDMSMTLFPARFSAIALFEGEDMPDRVRIVSRGLAKEECERYAKSLLMAHQKRQPEKDPRTFVLPTVRETEWGPVLECPMLHHELHGVLSVSAGETNEDDVSFLGTLAIIGAIALHYYKGWHGSGQHLVHQLHQAVAVLNPEVAERSVQLQELADAFSDELDLPEAERERIRQAALLYACPPALLHNLFAADPRLAAIAADAHRLAIDRAKEPLPDQTEWSEGGELLGLLARYLQADRRLDDVVWDRESVLFRRFSVFLCRQRIQDRQVRLDGEEGADLSLLSNREREVFRLLVEGMSNRQIAKALFISEHTVKNHITNIFGKLSIRDRAEAMAFYYKMSR